MGSSSSHWNLGLSGWGKEWWGRGVSLVGVHTYVTRARALLSLEAVARDS